jgi:hypothetical protein
MEKMAQQQVRQLAQLELQVLKVMQEQLGQQVQLGQLEQLVQLDQTLELPDQKVMSDLLVQPALQDLREIQELLGQFNKLICSSGLYPLEKLAQVQNPVHLQVCLQAKNTRLQFWYLEKLRQAYLHLGHIPN